MKVTAVWRSLVLIANGTVNANGLSTVVSFEYGFSEECGNTAPASENPVNGSTDTVVRSN